MIEKKIFEAIKNNKKAQEYLAAPREIKIKPIVDRANLTLSKINYVRWIGVQDKNKREIYEGDIVKFQNKDMIQPAIGVILFSEAKFYVETLQLGKLKFNEYECDVDFYDHNNQNFAWNELEVISNIFEIKDNE